VGRAVRGRAFSLGWRPERDGLPYSVRKTNGDYQVVDRETGQVFSRHTTKERAERQRRLLEGVRHGWKPTGKKPDES
jgi:hypothetical protein